MGFELGLIGTIVLGLWVVVDIASARPRRPHALPPALLGLSAALWAAGELLVVQAGEPGEVLAGRRLLYLGTSVLPVAWLLTAAEAARAPWRRRAPSLALAPAAIQAVLYALLYTDLHAWLVHGTARPAVFGPLFALHVGIGWTLIAIGTGYFLLAAVRLGKASPLRMVAICGGASLPLLSNLVHLVSGRFTMYGDPTPILVGFGVVAIRLAVLDSGLAAFLPVARRDVIEQLGVGVLVADLDGRIVDANPAAVALSGETTLAGQPLEPVLGRLADDSHRAIEIDAFPVQGTFGTAGTCVVVSDRTESRRVDQQLQQAQRLESLGFLTAGIAHEINNPLAFMKANLHGLEELSRQLEAPGVRHALGPKGAELAADAPDIVAEMQDGLARIGRLVERLTGFARTAAPQAERQPVDLLEVVEKACALAALGLPPHAIRTRLHPVPPVQARSDELVQVLTNLLVNAIQASGDRADIEVELYAEGAEVRVVVSDRGTGISDDVLPHLFDPFFTTKEPGQGTGLGLSLSLDIVRRQGGTLEAANRPGGGAVFTLRLQV
ncbi:MAG: ATP-binding protein [Myxococcota bacterium]|nr:ATP-binding protein [Myxococcota bacterium]